MKDVMSCWGVWPESTNRPQAAVCPLLHVNSRYASFLRVFVCYFSSPMRVFYDIVNEARSIEL